MLQAIISAESAKVVSQNSEEIRKGALSDAGKAKIRYVGGMCIAKCRAHICNIIKEKLGDPREDAQPKLHTAKKHLEFLYSLDASLEEKENACSDNSFEEIERKQNVTKCLTYINEKCYTFFLLLNTKVSEIMTTDAFEKEKESLFGKCFTFLLHDEELKSIWAELCQKIIKIDVSMYIFENIVKRYLKVNQKQFLKDTKSYLNVKKKKSHREEIKSKSVNKKTDEKLNMQSIETDNSVNKERSHLRLKLNCLENDNFLARTAFLKKDLTKLCDAYNVKYSQNMKKDTLAMTLREKILQSEHMINCDIFQQPMCSASQEPPPKKPKRSKSKSKKKSVRKRKSLETEYFCGKCGIVYNDGEEWIQCDICESWYHRACTDLQNDEDWEHVQDSEVDWTCDQCN